MKLGNEDDQSAYHSKLNDRILLRERTMMWFESLLGFAESSPTQVRDLLRLEGTELTSLANGRSFQCGSLQIPSLNELRSSIPSAGKQGLQIRERVANVENLHQDPANANSLFQVASQFNLLEMASPNLSPNDGVAIYQNDWTQGPACAIACGAGTVFRNYFATVNGQLGQSADNQIDCLADVGSALGNNLSEDQVYWKMVNGYAQATKKGLKAVCEKIASMSEVEQEQLRGLLRIGIHSNTQVTVGDCEHTVSQVYGSALPVAYCGHGKKAWTEFAQLILDASYEATFCAAIINSKSIGSNKLFLTLLGGGAFGNDSKWIFSAIRRSIDKFKNYDLDVQIVSYGTSNKQVQELIQSAGV